MKTAIFAAGCFWCYEPIFKVITGVQSTQVGYTGGELKNPTYEQVCTGLTGHAEAVKIDFDENTISYDKLLEVFWNIHDPTSLNRQGNDVGTQYRSAIFYTDKNQKEIAEKSKQNAQKYFQKPIVTEITEAKEFFPATDDHQDFYNKNPKHGYCQIVIQPKVKKFLENFTEIVNHN